jgi:rod shape determining protein RodA
MLDKRLIRNFDYLLLIIILLITGIGLFGIVLATRSPVESGVSPGGTVTGALGSFNLKQVKLQLLWFVSGLVMMGIVISIDYHVISDLSFYFYWLVVGLLIAVELMGTKGGGAQSWIAIGPFRMQPSEFSKLAVILALARIIAKREEKGINNFKSVAMLLAALAVPFAFIVKQPDFGTAMVLIVIFMGMIFVGGINYKLLFAAIGAGLAAIPAVWFTFLDDYQKHRILVFLNPGMDPLGKGYHATQSKLSIGSGQLTGHLKSGGFLFQNMLSQLDFLPAKDTDFIFSVTGEALGFIGGITVIVLFFLLLMRTMRLAVKARDTLGALICTGVASMILFHVFENIGMAMGIMPITGIPLPFMSYGGSSMWTNMVAFGLVLNVGMRRQKIKF